MKKFIKILKNISLSQKEKDVLRYKIEQFISFNPIRNEIHIPKKSFYFSVFTFRAIGKGVALLLIALTVVGGTGVSYASTDSLPGDKLYNVKINVNEKIEEKLAFTIEAKVVVQTQKVERRLTEVQKLVEKKDFSDEKKEIVKTNLEKNVAEVTKTITNLKNEGKIEEALNTTSRITPVLEAHKKVLTEQKAEADLGTENKYMTSFSSFAVVEESKDSILESVDAAIQKFEDAEREVMEEMKEDQKTSEEVTERNKEEVTRIIENLKKENPETDLNTKEEGLEVEIAEELKPTEDTTLLELKSTQENEVSSSIIAKSIQIISETDAELKVKEAENLLLKAEEARILGDFKEALTLSQQAKKIISEIEEYNKIKTAESLSEEKTTEENLPVIVPKEKIPTVTEEKIEINTKAQIEILPINIKAEAIRSLEETNASLKKINLSQSTGSRLLQ